MKQTIIFFASLLLALAIPHSVKAYDFSAVAPSGQTLYYNIVDGHAEVVRQGTSSTNDNYVTGDLIIPATVIYNNNTYAVTVLATVSTYGSFEGCSGLTSVTIPNSVTSIGYKAFYGCSGLTAVNYTGTIAQWCGIDFSPYSNPTIYSHTLSINGSLLTNLVIPEVVTEIKPYAFRGCSGLTSVTIPDGVTSIGSQAFEDCSGLTSVTIPNSVTSIGSSAFSGCSGLTSVTIGSGVTSIGNSAFWGCSGLTSVTIPDGVTSIGNGAFEDCSGLTSVTIGSGVTSIGDDAFAYCSGLTSVTIPDGVTSIGERAFQGCSGLTSVTIGSGVTSIGSFAFYDCSGLTSVTIGSGVTSIGEYAFLGCSGLDTVFMGPETAPSLGQCCFYNNATGRVFMIPCGSYDSYYQGWFDYNGWSEYRYYLREPVVDLSISVATSNPYYGSASVMPIRGNNVYCDSTTIVYATADEHCVFDHWSNGNTANPDTLHLTSDSAVTAVFIPNQYALTVSSNDPTLGSVVGSGTYEYLDTVSISATAIEHYHFVRWDDGNTQNPRNIIMTNDISRSAIFAIDTHSVTVQAANITHGTCNGNGQYQYGTAATVEALPYSGYQFSHWSDGSTYNPYTFAVVSDVQLTAHFYAVGTPYQDTLTVYDTVYMSVYVHDTTYVPVHDTTTVFDTIYITQTDTLWLYDTVFVHDTIYIHDTIVVGVDEVDAINAKIYQRDGLIVVEGAENNMVWLYDVNGRILATKQDEYTPLHFDVPASGAYLIKIGNHPARKVVVIK